jgi:hypothetical protein
MGFGFGSRDGVALEAVNDGCQKLLVDVCCRVATGDIAYLSWIAHLLVVDHLDCYPMQ